MKAIFFTQVLLLTTLFNVGGTEINKKQYSPTRISNPPEIDGVLDEEIWEEGNWESGFVQFEPHNGQEPSQPTEFCIYYDDDNLYVAIRAYDSSPDSIVQRLTRRDQEDGDVVGIAFDSYYDLRTGFAFGVSAGGTKFDWIITNDGQNEDRTWDPNWWVSTSVNDQGWVAEMQIPFSQLRFERNGKGVWGLQVFRGVYREGELNFWQPTPQNAPGFIHRFGLMNGLENVEPRTIFDITPYTVTSAESFEAQAGNPFLTGSDYDLKAGLDAKIGVTNNLTLDLTVNPDFGQVEADPSEVNLTAYETFYRERRPFFIEGQNISSFSLGIGDGGIGNDNLFYSRRIGRRPQGNISVENGAHVERPSFTNILGAAKLTGRTEDGLSVAIIQSVTAEEKAEIDMLGDRSLKTVEPLTNYFVSRVQKDFGDGNTLLGGMFTNTYRNLDDNLSDQMHSTAFSGGVDFTQYFKDKTWMFNINTAVSHVEGSNAAIARTQRSSARYFQRPDAEHVELDSTRTSLTGTGGKVQISKTGGGHWNFMGAMLWKSPQFEINDLGYIRETDQLLQVLWAGYREWEPNGIYRNYNINMNQYTIWAFDGKRTHTGFNLNGSMMFKNYWRAFGGLEYTHDILSRTHLRGGPAIRLPNRVNSRFGFGSDNRKKITANINGSYNTGMENNSNFYRVSPSITYKPADMLNLSFNPSYTKRFEELQYVNQSSYNDISRYVFASIDQEVVNFSFRVNLTVLPDVTLQYWGQPFIAIGNYHDYKYITNPLDTDYHDRFHVYDQQEISFEDGTYKIDENLDGTVDYQFGNPNFRMQEFLSNLVIRWEYNPGSTLFLVWNQNRTGFGTNGNMDFFADMDRLFSEKPHNIFLLKFSYRIGLR